MTSTSNKLIFNTEPSDQTKSQNLSCSGHLRTINSNSNFLKTQSIKKVLKRNESKVNEDYLFSKEEVRQKLATQNLFKKFDVDGSGALDSRELATLYKDNGFDISQNEILSMYSDYHPGSPPQTDVKFTLDMCKTMLQEKKKLRQFRHALAQIKPGMSSISSQKYSSFVPSTFDMMLLELGNRMQRKQLQDQCQSTRVAFLRPQGANSQQVIDEKIKNHQEITAKQFMMTVQTSTGLMNSTENVLYRKLKEKAMREKHIKASLKQNLFSRIRFGNMTQQKPVQILEESESDIEIPNDSRQIRIFVNRQVKQFLCNIKKEQKQPANLTRTDTSIPIQSKTPQIQSSLKATQRYENRESLLGSDQESKVMSARAKIDKNLLSGIDIQTNATKSPQSQNKLQSQRARSSIYKQKRVFELDTKGSQMLFTRPAATFSKNNKMRTKCDLDFAPPKVSRIKFTSISSCMSPKQKVRLLDPQSQSTIDQNMRVVLNQERMGLSL